MSLRLLITHIVAGLCALVMISCAGIEKAQPSFGKSLSERAKLFWEAFASRDWDRVESLIDPEIRDDAYAYMRSLRESIPMAEYQAFREKAIEINDDRAIVTYELEIKYLHPMLDGLSVQQRSAVDEWVMRNNQWYIVIIQPDMNKFLESFTN